MIFLSYHMSLILDRTDELSCYFRRRSLCSHFSVGHTSQSNQNGYPRVCVCVCVLLCSSIRLPLAWPHRALTAHVAVRPSLTCRVDILFYYYNYYYYFKHDKEKCHMAWSTHRKRKWRTRWRTARRTGHVSKCSFNHASVFAKSLRFLSLHLLIVLKATEWQK